MKHSANYLIWAALLACCLSCEPKTPEPLADSKPRLVSIKFPGIPAENVSIDQQNFVVTVKVPSLLPSAFEPKVKVTENAIVLSAEWVAIFTFLYTDAKLLVGYGNSLTPPSAYAFNFVPSGPLKIVNAGAPVEYVLHNEYTSRAYFPTENLYGNKLPAQIKLINRTTKETTVLANGTSNDRYRKGWATEANNIGISFYDLKLVPGRYDVELVTKTGENMRYDQTLLIKKGPLDLEGWAGNLFLSPVLPGETLTVKGSNLFEGDVSLELVDAEGSSQPLQNLTFDPYGEQLKVVIPALVDQGHRVLRFTSHALPFWVPQGGETETACRRIYVGSKARIPFEIFLLADGFSDCSIIGPVVVTREKFTQTFVRDFDAKVRLKLVSLKNVKDVRYGSATVFSSGNPEAGTSIFVPSDVFQRVCTRRRSRCSMQAVRSRKKSPFFGESWKYVKIVHHI